MQRAPASRGLILPLILLVLVWAAPSPSGGAGGPPADGPGEGSLHRDDPCEQLPAPLGNANGIERKCDLGGSSSGVTKGDFNGDGFADLAIGEPGATVSGQASAGDVVVIYGSGGGLTTTTSGIPGRQLFYEGQFGIPSGSPRAGDRFGRALASGDFDGDGYSDLAIGIPYRPTGYQYGALVIIYGSPHGLTTTDFTVPRPQYFYDLPLPPSPCGFSLSCRWDSSSALIGSALAWGDFNGDGFGDLAVGAPGETFDSLTGNQYYGGSVFELFGGPKGLSLSGSQMWTQNDVAGVQTEAFDHFGTAVAAGDFDGDGFSDLAVGTPDENFEHSDGSVTVDAGLVVVLYGSTKGAGPYGAQIWTQNSYGIQGASESYDRFGSVLAAGDFNGDGRSDLAVGVPLEDVGGIRDAGGVNVIYGSSSGLTQVGDQFWDQDNIRATSEAGDRFGTALAAGDFDGDGRADLAVGVPLEDIGSIADAGEVDVIYGSTSGLSVSARVAQFWTQNSSGVPGVAQSGDRFGSSLTAWNFGRNELGPFPSVRKTADLAIGVPYEDVNGVANAGAVNVLYGSYSSDGLTSAGSQFLTGDSLGLRSLPSGYFGAAVY